MIGTLNNNGRTFPLGIIGFLLKDRTMWKNMFLQGIIGRDDLDDIIKNQVDKK